MGAKGSPNDTSRIEWILYRSQQKEMQQTLVIYQQVNINVWSSAVSDPTRGVWGGGYTPSSSDVIDYVNICNKGNAADFGDLFEQHLVVKVVQLFQTGHGGL